MIDLLVATALACTESKVLVKNIMKNTKETVLYRHELIEVIKTNTEPGCYDGSERYS